MAYEGAIGTASSSAQISDSDHQENLNSREGNGVTPEDVKVQDNISVLVKAQALISQVLGFLSTANNETIGACLVGLVTITYLVLGRVGLMLIGVVVGVVLHATWEETINTPGNAHDVLQEIRKTKKEQGFALLERVLDWRETKMSTNGFNGDVISREISSMVSSTDLDFSDLPPRIGAALNTLTEAVIRDYVKYEDYQSLLFPELTYLAGGIVLFCLWTFPFQQSAEKPLQSSSLQFRRIFHEKDRLIHF